MTLNDFAEILRVGHRGPIVEADEWRPLAQHVIQLLIMQREACADAMHCNVPGCTCNGGTREQVLKARLVTEIDR